VPECHERAESVLCTFERNHRAYQAQLSQNRLFYPVNPVIAVVLPSNTVKLTHTQRFHDDKGHCIVGVTKTPPRFLFRVAAGPRIGFGHLMRCAALARALKIRPLVSVRGGEAMARTVRGLGFDLTAGFDLSAIDVVIVDDPSPRHARTWLKRAKRAGATTATIHDLGVGCHDADLVVDGSVTARPLGRGAAGFRGPRFTVVDPRVLIARTARRPRRTLRRPRVLIALGGGSHVFTFVQPLVRDIARRCPRAEITVAAGVSRQPRPSLGSARWIERPHGLAPDLARSDVAVVAGGVTLYEACAIGVPIVALSVVPAQRAAIEAIAAHGAAVDCGPGACQDRTLVVDRAGEAVAMFLADWPARRHSTAAARRLIDGRGALRLASRLRALALTRRS
jgi:UDP-2,4-diacetamido-2,4,6-trideoxy-beta-L-altropyranose hydrolase